MLWIFIGSLKTGNFAFGLYQWDDGTLLGRWYVVVDSEYWSNEGRVFMQTYRIVIDVEPGGSIEFGWWVEHRLLSLGCELEEIVYPRAMEILASLSASLERDGWFLLYDGDGMGESFCSDGVWVSLELEKS